MQEVHSSVLLVAPGQETLSIRAFTLLHYAPDNLLAAFCIISMAVMVTGVMALGLAGGGIGWILKRVVPDCALD